MISGTRIDATHHSEVEITDDVLREDKDISGMRVGMKKAVCEDLFHNQVKTRTGDDPPVEAFFLQTMNI